MFQQLEITNYIMSHVDRKLNKTAPPFFFTKWYRGTYKVHIIFQNIVNLQNKKIRNQNVLSNEEESQWKASTIKSILKQQY